MASPDTIAQQFLVSYYQTFDTNRSMLGSLYRPESVLDFETSKSMGSEAIVKHLTELPFRTVQHQISVSNTQMTVDGGLLIFVLGQLKTDNDPVQGFSETFLLKQIDTSLFIMNDIFRLHLHHHAT